MSGIPGIYGDVPADAETAYRNWLDAVMRRADHALDCRDCTSALDPRCPTGYLLRSVEYAFWANWYEARTGRKP